MKKFFDGLSVLGGCVFLPLFFAFLFKTFFGGSDTAAIVYGVGVCLSFPVWAIAYRFGGTK